MLGTQQKFSRLSSTKEKEGDESVTKTKKLPESKR